jgi:hypothetical protein
VRARTVAAAAAIGVLSCASVALADFDANYCSSFHSPGYHCSGGLGSHSWDYNRVKTGVTTNRCQFLEYGGSYRSGFGCVYDVAGASYSHQYSGGSPMTVATCSHGYPASSYLDCLASTP